MSKNETRQNILSAARTAFIQFGYEKTAMEDIARMANRAKTSIYYYFDNKDEIFKTVVEQECEAIRLELEPLTVLEGQRINISLKERAFQAYQHLRVQRHQPKAWCAHP